MTPTTNHTLQIQLNRNCNSRLYQKTSLARLANRIVRYGDKIALREIHDHRPLFRLRGKPTMLMAEFIKELCHCQWAQKFSQSNCRILDLAYDLTIDKYSNIPLGDPAKASTNLSRCDCRNYFRIFFKILNRWKKANPSASLLAEEIISAKILQSGVARNFRLSCLEARRRSNPAVSRYAWKINGHVVYLWMPTALGGHKRRNWLERNIQNVEPQHPCERARIQAIINNRFGVACHVPLNGSEFSAKTNSNENSPLNLLIQQEISIFGMATVVADEKAANLNKQRPAIQALGADMLDALIHRIFKDLVEDCYEEKQLAEKFKLSRPTLSRFAGCKWDYDSQLSPPDLWANLAQTLASHRIFIETARQTCLWNRIRKLTEPETSNFKDLLR
jgi:hypothetical protein